MGNFLKAFFKKHRLPIAALARNLGVAASQVQYYLTSESIKTSALFGISHAFQHNFFADFAATLPAHYLLDKPDNTLPDRIKELEAQLAQVIGERDLLKKVLKGK